jgi:hypothetical protein
MPFLVPTDLPLGRIFVPVAVPPVPGMTAMFHKVLQWLLDQVRARSLMDVGYFCYIFALL